MSEIFAVPTMANYRADIHIREKDFAELYQSSLDNNDVFWAQQAERLHWHKKWDKVSDWQYGGDHRISWYLGGELNVCYNCVDRHLKDKAEQAAILWVAENPQEAVQRITYRQLHQEVCRFANVLIQQGVKKGDRVSIYMPMIPEAVYAMLACARLGAVHSVVFAGFSPESLAGRILDCDSRWVITADEGVRAGKTIPLKKNVDLALEKCPLVKSVICVQRTQAPVAMKEGRDHWYHVLKSQVGTEHSPEPMEAEHPLFLLYTSGSTGKPKGVLHTSGGYLVYASLTHEQVFDYHPGDIYWCTADIGWITGHSYLVYGPLANAATNVIYEGTPTYPDASRHWQIIDALGVNTYYTAPTAIRALMAKGDSALESSHRKSLRLLGSVGEPINPEAWHWYFHQVGHSRCPIVDTWWQTETGGILISPLPGARKLKSGSATLPLLGIEAALLDENNNEIQGPGEGRLVIKRSWPGQMRTIYGDHQRFIDTYFSQAPGYYFTGDGCRRDEDGYLWITGRMDDVINVSGHRLGSAEIESSLVAHPAVAEAAVVGFPHPIKGSAIFAFVALQEAAKDHAPQAKDLIQWVRQDIGALAAPEHLLVVRDLPKTRSGKIMRRILRKIAEQDCAPESLGDTSTLADPAIVSEIIAQRTDLTRA